MSKEDVKKPTEGDQENATAVDKKEVCVFVSDGVYKYVDADSDELK